MDVLSCEGERVSVLARLYLFAGVEKPRYVLFLLDTFTLHHRQNNTGVIGTELFTIDCLTHH
jgi:hypothetical protein